MRAAAAEAVGSIHASAYAASAGLVVHRGIEVARACFFCGWARVEQLFETVPAPEALVTHGCRTWVEHVALRSDMCAVRARQAVTMSGVTCATAGGITHVIENGTCSLDVAHGSEV